MTMRKLYLAILTVSMLYGCGTSKNSNTTVNENNLPNVEVAVEEEVKAVIAERPVYHASTTVVTDLIHTKLEVSFDWPKSQMKGSATLTLSPRFYPTDSLILSAQAMEILSVTKDGKPLSYKYNDAQNLRIKLDKQYTKDEKYKVLIDYIAKPEEKKLGGSSAISSDKGLYFINPKGENPNQMPQIWTQGETEANSVWFPTFDHPNFKSTQEIFITVEDKYKTLSNGKLISSQKNTDGTRTDYWKQDLPHAPYLFMMAIGEFKIVEDSYKKADGTVIPVHYYVEPEWEEHAQAIFGETPAMLKFFSEKLGVEYPWDKYHQVVAREYVSGAMENTSASLFGDFVYKTSRELIDSHSESIIAHELFHHWFGNLVTAESWSNLPLNESFANYSQYLWDEFRHGRDEADFNAEKEKDGYYQTAGAGGHHPMIWYDYEDHENMFDAHAYNKGGRILHMLRYYLGDDAFFAGLNLYLEKNIFKAAEMANLRLAFEEVSGEDLNWFFDQWFFAEGHPELKITQEIKENAVLLKIEQTQNLANFPLYKIPTTVGVYAGGGKISHSIVIDKSVNEYVIPFTGDIENVIVDEERVVLGKITHRKPREWYVHQYYNAPRYLDRREAIINGSMLRTQEGKDLIEDATEDDFWEIRKLALDRLNRLGQDKEEVIFAAIENAVVNDESSKVRAFAASFLADNYLEGTYADKARTLLKNAIEKDESYLVISSALSGLAEGNEEDVKAALKYAESFESENSSTMRAQIISIYQNHGDESKMAYMSRVILNGEVSGYDMIGALMSFANFYANQTVDKQLEYFYVLEELSNKSDAYINAIFPMNVMTLIRSAESRAESDSEIDKEKNQEYIDKLMALMNFN